MHQRVPDMVILSKVHGPVYVKADLWHSLDTQVLVQGHLHDRLQKSASGKADY